MSTKTRTRPVDVVLGEITEVARERAAALAAADAAYQKQLALMVEAREGVDEKATFARIATAIKEGGGPGTVVGVDAALRKFGEKRGSKVG